MKTKSAILIALISCLAATGLFSLARAIEETPGSKAAPGPAPVYTVVEYDPDRDPSSDLSETVKRAKSEGKRILIQVGGNWCGWCRTMSKYFHDNTAVAEVLARDFLIMKVNYSGENTNTEFLDNYPEIRAFPHLFVLDGTGRVLHSQDTAEFEKRGSYDEKSLVAFLTKWAPKRDNGSRVSPAR